MLKVERQNVIERELNKQGFVLVPALSEMFRCSEETIRRDLKEMESMGRLVRTHGGAYLMEKYDKSYPTNLRKSYYLNTKERLAQRAMQYISDNDVIMMDSSTTCLTLAELLAKSQKPLTIITNSHQICNVCNESNTNINLICLGGTFRKRTSSFADAHTAELISCGTVLHKLSQGHPGIRPVRQQPERSARQGKHAEKFSGKVSDRGSHQV